MFPPPFIAAPARDFSKRKRMIAASATLQLISATYEANDRTVTLTFNQDINTDNMTLSAFVVTDAEYQNEVLEGVTTTGLTANSVTIEMEMIGTTGGGGVSLTVDIGNGIVPATGGDEWTGVSGLALPFG